MPSPRVFQERREATDDRATARREQTTIDLAANLNTIPFLRGKIVACKFTAAGTYYTFRHGLGVPAACFVIRQNYDAAGGAAGPTFAENPSQAGLDTKNEISLVANNICTVDMWFYPRASKTLATNRIQSL